MRRVGTGRAGVLVRTAGSAHLGWVGPAVLLCAAAGWWLFGPGRGGGGTALGILAAGGWGLGLLPVHADRRLTGPARRPPRRTGDAGEESPQLPAGTDQGRSR
ncbi:hypothetical protein [Kitasatospora sp. NPDC051914]|uniref:hypothetical protein n=1 Tax=Kitasatospora sp. NPDC051914 TaxID=3154945 RepID=UPI003434CEAD